MNPKEFAQRTQTLLASLGQKHLDSALEDWAHCLLDLNDQGVAGRLSEAIREDLQQNTFKRNKLHYLIDEIYTLPNSGTFTNPTDPARLFHIQRGAPFKPDDATRIPEWQNQEELNAASATLHTLNPNGGLFKQPAARRNAPPPPEPRPLNPRPQRAPPGPPPQAPPARPLRRPPGPPNPAPLPRDYGVFNTVAEAKDNLFNLKMRPEERFMTFIIRFKKEAYEMG
ncbi:hypothetical protein C0992_008917 [Termitomyces sp. T32_za158]|nr:hypothetical protein C0992_008917 [Termitomyces sp. T32_za158]